ncbi:MAG: serine hydrolase domain-containing protein [Bacteroidota bacterium]
MHPQKLFLCAFIIFFLLSCQKKAEKTDPHTEQISLHLDTLLQDVEFESLAVGIIAGAKEYQLYRGKLLNGEKPNKESLYEIASITKTFTGTLAARAVLDKKLELDADIRNYLPGVFPNLEYEGTPITVRNLLTHQGGIPLMFPDQAELFDNPDFNTLPTALNKLQKNFSKADFFDELAKVRLDTLPGINFAYSNAGANLMGYMLEEVYQEDYEDLLEEFLFTPLGMDRSAVGVKEGLVSYLVEGQNHHKLKMPFSVEKDMSAEGGIVSGIEDLLKYARFQLEEEKEWVRLCQTDLWEGTYGDFGGGFFWQLNKDGDNPDRVFQNGGAFGTATWLSLLPKEDIALILITNVSGPETHRKISERVEPILDILIQNSPKNE